MLAMNSRTASMIPASVARSLISSRISPTSALSKSTWARSRREKDERVLPNCSITLAGAPSSTLPRTSSVNSEPGAADARRSVEEAVGSAVAAVARPRPALSGDAPQAALQLLYAFRQLRRTVRRRDVRVRPPTKRVMDVVRGRERQDRKYQAGVLERGEAPLRSAQDLR